MEPPKLAPTRAQHRVQEQASHLQIMVVNLIRRYHTADGALLAAMLSLTCVLIVSWAISMR